MTESIPFALPFIGKEEEEAVLRVLRSGWLTTGKEALAFEQEFTEFLQSYADETPRGLRCLAVNSATSGLHLALEALGIGKGDAVLLPAYTFASTAETVRYLGAECVFVDIAPDSYNIDPAALEESLAGLAAGKTIAGAAGRPRAVVPVHFGGLPCDMEAITDISRKYGLAVIEDAAHAFPARIGKRAAGTAGDAGVFSFYATKTITTGEGGMLVTANQAIAGRAALMRCHGIDRPVWNRYTDTKASWYYEVKAPGFKYNLPDILAAIGRVQLSRAADLLEKRKAIAARYDAAFAGTSAPEGELLVPPSAPGDARHLYPLRLKNGSAAADGVTRRDSFSGKLQKAGIGISVHFIPLHIMPYYKDRYCLRAEDFPESYKRFGETVSLPLWPGMTDRQLERVISAVLT